MIRGTLASLGRVVRVVVEASMSLAAGLTGVTARRSLPDLRLAAGEGERQEAQAARVVRIEDVIGVADVVTRPRVECNFPPPAGVLEHRLTARSGHRGRTRTACCQYRCRVDTRARPADRAARGDSD